MTRLQSLLVKTVRLILPNYLISPSHADNCSQLHNVAAGTSIEITKNTSLKEICCHLFLCRLLCPRFFSPLRQNDAVQAFVCFCSCFSTDSQQYVLQTPANRKFLLPPWLFFFHITLQTSKILLTFLPSVTTVPGLCERRFFILPQASKYEHFILVVQDGFYRCRAHM